MAEKAIESQIQLLTEMAHTMWGVTNGKHIPQYSAILGDVALHSANLAPVSVSEESPISAPLLDAFLTKFLRCPSAAPKG